MSKWIAEFELEDGDRMPEHMDLEYHGVKLDFYCRPLEQEPCEDAVSRAEVLNLVRLNAFHAKSQIKAIENMPSVTPQEQFKPMVEIDLYSVIKQKYIEREVLDKIRAEIKKSSHGKWYVGRIDGKTEEVLLLDEVMQILDKYKTGSEE